MPSRRGPGHVAPMTVFEEAAYAQGYRWIAGLDEVGRGTLAGPVVAAAVLFRPETVITGVRDSKQLSPQQRDSFYPIILQEAAAVAVGMVEAAIIDQINILQQQPNSRLLEQAIGQPLGQRPAAVIFELANKRFERIVIDAQAGDAVERI